MDQEETISGTDQPAEFGFKDWGFRVDRLFEVAYRFHKRNESKVFHLSFDERNQMTALTLQARYGDFNSEKVSDIGALDLVGKNRRHQWSLLSGMSKTEAKLKFISNLDEFCPIFKAYAEAVKLSSTGQHGSNQESDNTSNTHLERPNFVESDEQLQAIKTSLNRQTYSQFKSYADKQHPGDLQKQKDLISSLQEQYYQQYISQLQPNLGKKTRGSSSIPSRTISESSTPEDSAPLVDKVNGQSYTQVQSNLSNISSHEDKGLQPQVGTIGSEQVKLNETKSIEEDLTSKQNHISYQSQVTYPPHNEVNVPHEFKAINNTADLTEKPSSQLPPKNTNNLQANAENNLKTTRQYPLIEPRLIGKFESFPEPKPVQTNSNGHSYIINMFHSNSSNEIKQQQDVNQITSPREPTETSSVNYTTNSSQNALPIQKTSLINESPPELNNIFKFDANATVEQANQGLPPPDSSQIDPKPPHENPLDGGEARKTVDLWSYESSSDAGSPLQQSISYEPLEQATIWTKRSVNEFRASLMNDKQGGEYVVKQGTVLVIRVPTYPEGKYIYWEFATEEYDIGFGLDFIYQPHIEQPLALKIYEEIDEDDEEDEELILSDEASLLDQEAAMTLSQKESILRQRVAKVNRAANTISIVPTYRRDSHEEVFVGRHRYPGQGYYLLKFDNTYSVLRSKTLFFRVCYFI